MPSWLPVCLHWPFCPGVFIAILAFMAAAVTFRKEPSSREKAVWIFVFLGLMSAEVWMMSKDRNAHDTAEQASRKTEQAHFDQTMGNFSDLQKLILSSSKAQAQVVRTAHLPEESLKKRASQLSAQIFSFLTDRKANEPTIPIGSPREQIDRVFQDIGRYGTQTTALYAEMFSARVVSIHDEFLRQGIRNEQFDTYYDQPVNPIGIEKVAAIIGALAERLKQ